MSTLNKKMISFSKLPFMIFLCILSLLILLVYLFFGRAVMSADNKLNDMIKYSNQYHSSFLSRTNLLYLYVDSSNLDYYSEYMKESVATGDMTLSRKMMLAIGLEKSEKEILSKIDSAWDKYIAPAEQNALNKMIQEAKPNKARKFISSNEYVSCIKYISDSQKTLRDSIVSRLSEEKKTYELCESVFQVILIFAVLGIIALSITCLNRIKRLGIMVENERESQKEIRIKNDVLKRREMRNSRRRKL